MKKNTLYIFIILFLLLPGIFLLGCAIRNFYAVIPEHYENILSDMRQIPDFPHEDIAYVNDRHKLSFRYDPNDIAVHELDGNIVVTPTFLPQENWGDTGVPLKIHEGVTSKRLDTWWLFQSLKEGNIENILWKSKGARIYTYTGREMYAVAPIATGSSQDPTEKNLSLFFRCGEGRVCEIESSFSIYYAPIQNGVRDIISTAQTVSPETNITDNNSDWLTYRNEKLGYSLRYPKDVQPIAPDRDAPADGDDTYVDLEYLHVRGLFCTFSKDDIGDSLAHFIHSNVKERRHAIFDDRSLEMVFTEGDNLVLKVSTYRDTGSNYHKAWYVKRGKIYYAFSLPIKYRKNQEGERRAEEMMKSLKILPLSDEDEASSQEACEMKNIGGNFFGNRYVIQYIHDSTENQGNNRDFFDEDRLKGADPLSFHIIGGAYSKDKRAVFFRNSRLNTIDVESFEYIGGDYAKDKDGVYVSGEKLLNADPKTFKMDHESVLDDKRKKYE